MLLVAWTGWRELRQAAPADAVQARELTITEPARSRRQIGERIRIAPGAGVGREAGNRVILDEDTVSSRHATLHYERGAWWLEDHGSTNGTWVNNLRVEGRVRLRDGDEVRFGRVAARFGPIAAASDRR